MLFSIIYPLPGTIVPRFDLYISWYFFFDCLQISSRRRKLLSSSVSSHLFPEKFFLFLPERIQRDEKSRKTPNAKIYSSTIHSTLAPFIIPKYVTSIRRSFPLFSLSQLHLSASHICKGGEEVIIITGSSERRCSICSSFYKAVPFPKSKKQRRKRERSEHDDPSYLLFATTTATHYPLFFFDS